MRDVDENFGDLVVRDDEAEFSALRDAAYACRRRRARFHLIDGGRLSVSELEWLGLAGADLYTSDQARRDLAAVVLMSEASIKGGAGTSYYHHGPVEETSGEGAVFAALREMARSRVAVALSNRSYPRPAGILFPLAADGAKGGSRFVYYHHGLLEPWLEDLARQGAWIHLATPSLLGEDEAGSVSYVARAATAAGGGVVLHVTTPVKTFWLENIFEAEAYLLFQTAPSDFRSPLRPLEDRAAHRIPPRGSSYLYREFMR